MPKLGLEEAQAELAKEFGVNLIDLKKGYKTQKLPKKVLNVEEAKRLNEALLKKLNSKLGYYLLLLNLNTGIRYVESAALTINDFDFNNNTINVNKNWTSVGRNSSIVPFNVDSRLITVDKIVMEKFKHLFSTLQPNAKSLVFYNSKAINKVITYPLVNKLLKDILLELNIEPISVNRLRNTHANVLYSQGEPVSLISKRLGHYDEEFTQKLLNSFKYKP